MKIADLSPQQRGHLQNKASAALQKLPAAGAGTDTHAERVMWEDVLEGCKGKPPEPPKPARRRRSRRRSGEGDSE